MTLTCLQVDEQEEHGAEDPDTATLSKKFSFFEKGADGKKKSEVCIWLCAKYSLPSYEESLRIIQLVVYGFYFDQESIT